MKATSWCTLTFERGACKKRHGDDALMTKMMAEQGCPERNGKGYMESKLDIAVGPYAQFMYWRITTCGAGTQIFSNESMGNSRENITAVETVPGHCC